MNEDFDKQEFIDHQFNAMRAQLYNLAEISLRGDTEVCEQMKKTIKSITTHAWNNFTRTFGTRTVYQKGWSKEQNRDTSAV